MLCYFSYFLNWSIHLLLINLEQALISSKCMIDYTCIYIYIYTITYIIMVPNIQKSIRSSVTSELSPKKKKCFNFPQVSFKKQNFQNLKPMSWYYVFHSYHRLREKVQSISMALLIKGFLLSVGYQHPVHGQGVRCAVACHNAALMAIHCKIVRAAAIFLRECFLKVKMQNQQFDHKV